jgi:hypothetical protein
VEDEPKPETRRRRGGTDGNMPTQRPRDCTGRPAARGRYVVLQPAKAPAATDIGPAIHYLADTLEWLQLWQDNAENESSDDPDATPASYPTHSL